MEWGEKRRECIIPSKRNVKVIYKLHMKKTYAIFFLFSEKREKRMLCICFFCLQLTRSKCCSLRFSSLCNLG